MPLLHWKREGVPPCRYVAVSGKHTFLVRNLGDGWWRVSDNGVEFAREATLRDAKRLAEARASGKVPSTKE